MTLESKGELVPVGGGDPIPLLGNRLTIGRRESCDICLKFPNISGLHCELVFRDGYWLVRDLNSTNGIKVNNQRVLNRVLRPDDEIGLAKRRFKIQYTPSPEALARLDEVLAEEVDIRSQSLLEKAGLQKSSADRPLRRLFAGGDE